MKLFIMITMVMLTSLSETALAEDLPQQSALPPGLNSGYETVQAEVLKVFAVDDDGARFRAYLVQWKESEVIVSDPLGKSDKKEGEKISFLAQRIQVPHASGNIRILHFTLLDVGMPTERIPVGADAALKKANDEQERFYALGRAAKQSFTKGDYPAAKTYAEELASLAPRYQKNWNYGNAIQDSNVVLGRLALGEGNVTAAKAFLLEAGRSKGSPQMNSFGPNLSLAKDLLERGEKKVVIEYLNACRKFWKMEHGKLDDWITLVKAGEIPNFGANLVY